MMLDPDLQKTRRFIVEPEGNIFIDEFLPLLQQSTPHSEVEAHDSFEEIDTAISDTHCLDFHVGNHARTPEPTLPQDSYTAPKLQELLDSCSTQQCTPFLGLDSHTPLLEAKSLRDRYMSVPFEEDHLNPEDDTVQTSRSDVLSSPLSPSEPPFLGTQHVPDQPASLAFIKPTQTLEFHFSVTVPTKGLFSLNLAVFSLSIFGLVLASCVMIWQLT